MDNPTNITNILRHIFRHIHYNIDSHSTAIIIQLYSETHAVSISVDPLSGSDPAAPVTK